MGGVTPAKVMDAIVAELRHEASLTRKMLERVPPAASDWKPHEKSRAVGEIAAHLANLPGLFLAPLNADGYDRLGYAAATGTVEEVLETFDRNVAQALQALGALTDAQLAEPWTYRYGDKVIFEAPRIVVIRGMALNHSIHHRGQLSVYLRLLNVPVPAVYGPTADEPEG